MYIYTCIFKACMYACMYECMYVRINVRMHVCMLSVCILTDAYIYIHNMYVSTKSKCMYVCMHVCMYVCTLCVTHKYIYIRVYIYTHIWRHAYSIEFYTACERSVLMITTIVIIQSMILIYILLYCIILH